ncbi:MAG TPA: FxLYD domain-containing protein [Verrucomicrobiae bacterium]|nr:FxLYD domain-containing protein [Verrucomicrobiae bacterium]
MAADKAVKGSAPKASIPPVAMVIGLVLVLGVAGFLYLDRLSKQPPPPPPPLTGEAREYVRARNLKLADVEMKAHESYLKQSVVEITGTIQNVGDRRLKSVEIYCVFYDPFGQVVLRERVPIVSQRTGGAAPGETKPFRLAFDNVPESWNQATPDLVIAAIEFA